MKIPTHLEQFSEEDSLILVTGKQDAAIYRASNGNLVKIDSFRLRKSRYSDNEGTIKHRSGFRDRDIIKDFVRELKTHFKRLGVDKLSAVYMFTPSYVKNQIKKALPVPLKNNIKAVIEGNYFSFGPLDLLGKLGA